VVVTEVGDGIVQSGSVVDHVHVEGACVEIDGVESLTGRRSEACAREIEASGVDAFAVVA